MLSLEFGHEAVKKGVRCAATLVKVEIIVDNESYVVTGYGDDRLSLLNKHDIVIRKTRFACPRTMSVGCDRASLDLPRNMVRLLQDSTTTGLFRISIE